MNESSRTQIFEFVFRRLEQTFPTASNLPTMTWNIALASVIFVGFLYIVAMVLLAIFREGGVRSLLPMLLPGVAVGVLATMYFVPEEQINSSVKWLMSLGVILLAAFCYVGMMYAKDSRSVGGGWAGVLGIPRALVYAALAFVFLLPTLQKYERTVTKSQAVGLFDTSLSMIGTRDDPPTEGQDPLKLPTRQDRVLAMLKDPKVDLISRLAKKNAIIAYRFGSGLDEGYFRFDDERFFSRTEWEDVIRHPEKRREMPPGTMPPEFWAGWLKPTEHLLPMDEWEERDKVAFKARKEPVMKPSQDWDDSLRDRFADLAKYNSLMHLKKGVFDGTNVYQSISDGLAREQNNLTRAIIVVSDGRSHLGSPEMIDEIKRKAKEKGIPIITIAVGATRPQARIEVVDVRHPKQIQPDDAFRVVAEVKGDGLPGEPFPVRLEVTKVRTETKTTKGEDGKDIVTKTETPLDITVVEQRPPKKRNPDEKPDPKEKEDPLAEVELGKSLILTPATPQTFDTSPRPRASVEFQIEAPILAQWAAKAKDESIVDAMKNRPLSVALASLAGKNKTEAERRALEAKFAQIKKWGLGETKPDEEYRFKVITEKHPLDTTPGTDHLSKTGTLRVLKKPLSVLIFSSSASKDYQFLRELLIRETQKDLARLTLVFQTASLEDTVHAPGVVHGVPERRLLAEFPGLYRPDHEITNPESEEAINDLASYDVVVALDPDWNRLKDKTIENLGKWVENGGGLVVLGGPMYTKRLAFSKNPDGKDRRTKLKPIVDLLPVILEDVDVVDKGRKPDSPWNLDLSGGTSELEFLKLSEDPKKSFLDDWNSIYGTSDDTKSHLQNGFYSFYPVKKATPGSQVVARYMDKEAMTEDNEFMPYIVISDPRSPKRVIWIGSCETWRLRQAKEAYHERFWTKLLRYAGARTQGKVNKRLTIELGGPYKTEQVIQIDAKYLGNNGQPVTDGEMKLTLKPRGLPGNIPLNLLEQTLKYKTGTDGIFSVQFRMPAPGTFDIEVTRDKDTETGTLVVEASNLEKDDTRPDFLTLYKLASDAEDVKNRMTPDEYTRLLEKLKPLSVEGEGEKAKAGEKDKPRLFFELHKGDLSNIELIPLCVDNDESVQTNRGKPEDLWDFGVLVLLTALLGLAYLGLYIATIGVALARQAPYLGVFAALVLLLGIGNGLYFYFYKPDPLAPKYLTISVLMAVATLAVMVWAILRPGTSPLGWGMLVALVLYLACAGGSLYMATLPQDQWNAGVPAVPIIVVLMMLAGLGLLFMQIAAVVTSFVGKQAPAVGTCLLAVIAGQIALGLSIYALGLDLLSMKCLILYAVLSGLMLAVIVAAIINPATSSRGWTMLAMLVFQWVCLASVHYLLTKSPNLMLVLLGLIMLGLQAATMVTAFVRKQAPVLGVLSLILLAGQLAYSVSVLLLWADLATGMNALGSAGAAGVLLGVIVLALALTVLQIVVIVFAVLTPATAPLGWAMAGMLLIQFACPAGVISMGAGFTMPTVSIVLLAVVTLLSLEWFSRKMLRLA
jgi:hypothetical protein